MTISFRFLSGIVFLLLIASCRRGEVTCYCKKEVNISQTYVLGKQIDWQDAISKCSVIENKDGWDTCLVIEPK